MEVRQKLLLNVTNACNYDENNANVAGVAYWGRSVDPQVSSGKLRGFEQRKPAKGLQ